MVARFKKVLKNQKGLTLIELLAVVVILGIISAIAVPSIGGIIDNTKKDAHIANATQMVSAAKIAVTSNKSLQPKGTPVYLSLKYLIEEGYIEPMDDPHDGTYFLGTYNTTENGKVNDGSVVAITNGPNNSYDYTVKLTTQEGHGISKPLPVGELTREQVK